MILNGIWYSDIRCCSSVVGGQRRKIPADSVKAVLKTGRTSVFAKIGSTHLALLLGLANEHICIMVAITLDFTQPFSRPVSKQLE